MKPIEASAEPDAIERVEMGKIERVERVQRVERVEVVAWSCKARILGPVQSSPGREGEGKARTNPLEGNTTP